MGDERDLVRGCLQGDQRAFARLVDQYKALVFNLALRTVPDREAAEDVAQETFVRVYRNLASFRGAAKLSTWIYQIAYRTCLEELQRPHHRQQYAFLDEDSEGVGHSLSDPAAEEVFAQHELRQLLDYHMARLPPRPRLALTLYYLHDRRYQEIAQIMEQPIGTVKTHLHRAKRYLRQYMSAEGANA